MNLLQFEDFFRMILTCIVVIGAIVKADRFGIRNLNKFRDSFLYSKSFHVGYPDSGSFVILLRGILVSVKIFSIQNRPSKCICSSIFIIRFIIDFRVVKQCIFINRVSFSEQVKFREQRPLEIS